MASRKNPNPLRPDQLGRDRTDDHTGIADLKPTGSQEVHEHPLARRIESISDQLGSPQPIPEATN